MLASFSRAKNRISWHRYRISIASPLNRVAASQNHIALPSHRIASHRLFLYTVCHRHHSKLHRIALHRQSQDCSITTANRIASSISVHLIVLSPQRIASHRISIASASHQHQIASHRISRNINSNAVAVAAIAAAAAGAAASALPLLPPPLLLCCCYCCCCCCCCCCCHRSWYCVVISVRKCCYIRFFFALCAHVVVISFRKCCDIDKKSSLVISVRKCCDIFFFCALCVYVVVISVRECCDIRFLFRASHACIGDQRWKVW